MPTAIIVDDEAPMRAQLSRHLKNVWPQLLILAEASSGVEAIRLVEQHKPDIIFLDIRMPGLSGIETAKVLFNQCHIVFVTAYDQYAVQAFDQGAVDYLLKPVDSERLRRTCERLRSRLDKQPENIEQLLKNLLQLDKADAPNYLRWIQASLGSSLRMISTQEILFFRADDKYTRVQTEKSEFLIRKPLKDLALELDPQEFWRIHRSTLVRVEAITEVTRDYRGRQIVHVRNHPEQLEVSRNYSHLFQQM
jgi:DNA-binding LytR/AlgR family response regulator